MFVLDAIKSSDSVELKSKLLYVNGDKWELSHLLFHPNGILIFGINYECHFELAQYHIKEINYSLKLISLFIETNFVLFNKKINCPEEIRPPTLTINTNFLMIQLEKLDLNEIKLLKKFGEDYLENIPISMAILDTMNILDNKFEKCFLEEKNANGNYEFQSDRAHQRYFVQREMYCLLLKLDKIGIEELKNLEQLLKEKLRIRIQFEL